MKIPFVVLVLISTTSAQVRGVSNAGPDIRKVGKHAEMVASMRLHKPLGDIWPELKVKTPGKIAKITNCYVGKLREKAFDILSDQLNFNDVVADYYNTYKDKRISESSIGILKDSLSFIVKACLEKDEGDDIKFGLTQLSDVDDAGMKKRMGLMLSRNKTRVARAVVGASSGADDICYGRKRAPRAFDWREEGMVSSVKDQGQCGSCWAFATTATIESAYMIKNDMAFSDVNLSEQDIVNCALDDGCEGGMAAGAMEFVQNNGLLYDEDLPYKARSSGCTSDSMDNANKVHIKDYCVRSREYNGDAFVQEDLNDDQMTRAIYNFGPVYACVDASGQVFRNYRGGTISAKRCDTQVGHAITIVGYTRNAWIIKNSWGEDWGDDGYFYLRRGENTCGIQTEVSYPIL